MRVSNAHEAEGVVPLGKLRWTGQRLLVGTSIVVADSVCDGDFNSGF